MKISAQYQFLPKTNSTRAAMVMGHFGIGFEQGQHTIAHDLELPITPGEILLFTGESGSGKSTLMKALRKSLEETGQTVISLDEIALGEKLLVDAFTLPFNETLQLLAACGLGEAHLLLRTPQELSDGQRYRFLLAQALAAKTNWILADEYTATLDRTLAKVVSFNLQKASHRNGTGFLLATTHDDIVEDLAPAVHVHCCLNGTIEITQSDPDDRKKKISRYNETAGSPQQPKPTGRTSLGGITAAINSDSSAA